MNALTLLRYLFGSADAIRQLAASKFAIPVGIFLVLTAGAARNYDQVWFGSTAKWLLGPLLFSTVSGFWLFLFVCGAWTGGFGPSPGPPGERWKQMKRAMKSFYGLFWLTAPLAWLYAIPVERWFDEVEAARWNLRLLAIVAVWRVLLIARVVSVIGGLPFPYGAARVLFPATLETFIIAGTGAAFGRRMMSAMGGLRNSPAETVIGDAYLQTISVAFLFAFISFAVLMLYWFDKRSPRPQLWTPEPLRTDRMPWVFLLLTAAFWAVISIAPQRAQRLHFTAESYAKNGDWKGLTAFLSGHSPEEFAPGRRLPPKIYEMESFAELSRIAEHLRPDTPAWIRSYYLKGLEEVISMEEYRAHFDRESMLKLVAALERLKDGPGFAARHKAGLDDALEKMSQPVTTGFPRKTDAGITPENAADMKARIHALAAKSGSPAP